MKIKIGNYEIEGTPSEMVELVSALKGVPKKTPQNIQKPIESRKSDERCISLTNKKKICKNKITSSFVCSKTGLEIMTPGGKYCWVHHPETKKHDRIVRDAGLIDVPYYNPNVHGVERLRERKRVLMENRIKYLEMKRS